MKYNFEIPYREDPKPVMLDRISAIKLLRKLSITYLSITDAKHIIDVNFPNEIPMDEYSEMLRQYLEFNR